MQPYERLETELVKWTGCEELVVCSSGTAALHLALETLRLPQRSAVIVPDFCMYAVPRAVSMAGLSPFPVEVKADTLNIDPVDVERVLDRSDDPRHTLGPSNGFSAIMAVHNYGRRCDMDALHRLANRYGLAVIEDMAELHGLPPDRRTDAACWSFYANKVVGGEEGGAVAFGGMWPVGAPVRAELARSLRCLGMIQQGGGNMPHDFTHRPRGHNYRLANSLAMLVLDSLRQVYANLTYRRRSELVWDKATPVPWRMPARDSVWVYDLQIPGLTHEAQARVVNGLNRKGVAARCAFRPTSSQEEYGWAASIGPVVCPNAYCAAREILYLPVLPVPSEVHATTVMGLIREIVTTGEPVAPV